MKRFSKETFFCKYQPLTLLAFSVKFTIVYKPSFTTVVHILTIRVLIN